MADESVESKTNAELEATLRTESTGVVAEELRFHDEVVKNLIEREYELDESKKNLGEREEDFDVHPEDNG